MTQSRVVPTIRHPSTGLPATTATRAPSWTSAPAEYAREPTSSAMTIIPARQKAAIRKPDASSIRRSRTEIPAPPETGRAGTATTAAASSVVARRRSVGALASGPTPAFCMLGYPTTDLEVRQGPPRSWTSIRWSNRSTERPVSSVELVGIQLRHRLYHERRLEGTKPMGVVGTFDRGAQWATIWHSPSTRSRSANCRSVCASGGRLG